MKQFQYVRPNGYTRGPFTAKKVAERYPWSAPSVSALQPGETYIDIDGDEWSIVPDVLDPMTEEVTPDGLHIVPKPVDEALEARSQQAERLERIALEYLRFMGPAYLAGELVLDQGEALVSCCVTNARHLIAELDKQS